MNFNITKFSEDWSSFLETYTHINTYTSPYLSYNKEQATINLSDEACKHFEIHNTGLDNDNKIIQVTTKLLSSDVDVALLKKVQTALENFKAHLEEIKNKHSPALKTLSARFAQWAAHHPIVAKIISFVTLGFFYKLWNNGSVIIKKHDAMVERLARFQTLADKFKFEMGDRPLVVEFQKQFEFLSLHTEFDQEVAALKKLNQLKFPPQASVDEKRQIIYDKFLSIFGLEFIYWNSNQPIPEKVKKYLSIKEMALFIVGGPGNFMALKHVPAAIKNDKDVVLKAVGNDGMALEHASTEMKDNKEVVLKAVETDGRAIQFASNKLRKDGDVVLKAAQKNGDILQYALDTSQLGREIFLAAVEKDGMALQYVNMRFIDDREIVLAAVKNKGEALQFARDKFQADRDIVLAAVKNDGTALKYADDSLKLDEEIVLAAIENNPHALKHAADKFKKDKNFVIKAVEIKGLALRYADEKLRADRDVVLKAVKMFGVALKFASPELQKDREIALCAVKNYSYAIKFVDKDLQKDSELVKLAAQGGPTIESIFGPLFEM